VRHGGAPAHAGVTGFARSQSSTQNQGSETVCDHVPHDAPERDSKPDGSNGQIVRAPRMTSGAPDRRSL